MAVQVSTMMSSVMYKSKLKMGGGVLIRVLMFPCEVYLRAHLSNSRGIALVFSGKGGVGVLGDAL